MLTELTVVPFQLIIKSLLFYDSLENMMSRNVFTISFNNKKEEVGVPVALESCSPNIFILGTELGALIGYDVRLKNKEVFRLQSDLKSGNNCNQ